MVIKVYVAMISCSQEVKKNQQRVIMILESKKIPYTIIDITDPSNEDCKDYMVENAKPKEGAKVPVTPQIFNEADYCGDFDGLDMANECDTLGEFLKLSDEEKAAVRIGITGIIPTKASKSQDDKLTNGVSTSREISPDKPIENATVSSAEAEQPTEETPAESVKPPEETSEEPSPATEVPSNDPTEPAGEVEIKGEDGKVEAPIKESLEDEDSESEEDSQD